MVYKIVDEDEIFNYDLNHIVTPLDVDKYEKLLADSGYDKKEAAFLVEGFRQGFDIGYQGPKIHQSTAANIPFTDRVGNNLDMWNKIMKEVKAKRVAGPFNNIPYDNLIQSPIGLVPKAGNKTRLIFHLSYEFGDGKEDCTQGSLNSHTPRELCTVKYKDLDTAVQYCLNLVRNVKLEEVKDDNQDEDTETVVYLGKTDLTSTFRVLPLKIECFCWLIFKAKDPKDGKYKYFVDKCLPFSASISCALYQKFSDSLQHIMQFKMGKKDAISNYLDDFLFLALKKWICDSMIEQFCSSVKN